jgi:hypothetical protein
MALNRQALRSQAQCLQANRYEEGDARFAEDGLAEFGPDALEMPEPGENSR